MALCGEAPLLEESEIECSMGVDTGRELHVVILRDDEDDGELHHVVHLAVCNDFSELDGLMKRFHVDRCVIDGLPETHATRAFSARHAGRVFLCFFNDHQRGEPKWDGASHILQVNRTEALDASRAIVRDKKLALPSRQEGLLDEFARHMACDAKILDEDEETGIQRYRYIRTGPNHFSMALTYAWLAATDNSGGRGLLRYMRAEVRRVERERGEQRPRRPRAPW